ncbi:MAG: YncE family protein [Acetobacteraceae bacterium]|nr:YncE family protein [Acetobacteraceae bacterium]
MHRFTARLCGAALCLVLGSQAVRAAAVAPSYTLTATVPLGAPDRWDYVVFDPATQRIYVAHGTAVTVVDATTLAVAGSLGGLDGAHGTAPVPALGKVFADSGKTGTVTVYDASTLTPRATIKAVGDADAMIYDAASQQVIVVGGDSASAGFIDPRTDQLTATLPLDGSPEGVTVDGRGKLFVNLADRDEIAVVETATRRIVARWALPGCRAPHGLALDPVTARLFASCPAGQMAVVDADDGREIALLPIGKGTDSAAFDPARRLALSADGDGTIGLVAETPSGGARALGTVPTTPGARTMAIDPATGRLFIAAATVAGVEAPRKPGARPHLTFVPGTLRLLVYTPQRAPQ